jgi:hypothetical protein
VVDFVHDILAQPWARVALVPIAALIIAIVIFNVLRFAARRVLRPGAVPAVVLQRCERPDGPAGAPVHVVQPLGGGSPSPEPK